MRHSLWEQGALEACNEWLFGYLDEEVRGTASRGRQTMMRRGGCQMGVTHAGVTLTVTLTVLQR